MRKSAPKSAKMSWQGACSSRINYCRINISERRYLLSLALVDEPDHGAGSRVLQDNWFFAPTGRLVVLWVQGDVLTQHRVVRWRFSVSVVRNIASRLPAPAIGSLLLRAVHMNTGALSTVHRAPLVEVGRTVSCKSVALRLLDPVPPNRQFVNVAQTPVLIFVWEACVFKVLGWSWVRLETRLLVLWSELRGLFVDVLRLVDKRLEKCDLRRNFFGLKSRIDFLISALHQLSLVLNHVAFLH